MNPSSNKVVDADVLSVGVRQPPAGWGHFYVIQRRLRPRPLRRQGLRAFNSLLGVLLTLFHLGTAMPLMMRQRLIAAMDNLSSFRVCYTLPIPVINSIKVPLKMHQDAGRGLHTRLTPALINWFFMSASFCLEAHSGQPSRGCAESAFECSGSTST